MQLPVDHAHIRFYPYAESRFLKLGESIGLIKQTDTNLNNPLDAEATASSMQCSRRSFQFSRLQVKTIYTLLYFCIFRISRSVYWYVELLVDSVYNSQMIFVFSVLTYIGVDASSHGVSSGFSFYLVAIANASSVFGRCGCGLISDRTGMSVVSAHLPPPILKFAAGPMNVMIPLTAITGLLTFIWPMAHSEASLIAIAILYGLFPF